MCFLVLLNHKQSRSCNFSWDRKWSNKLARVRLQEIHSATNFFCHFFVLLSGRPQGDRWTRGWLVCDSGLSVGWAELNQQLRCAKSFSLRREAGCTVCICLRNNLTCLRHLFMDLGNDQIWKGNLIYQQVSQNPHSTPLCSPESACRPQSRWFTPSTAVAASPAPSPSPFPVIPDSGFAFCSNKENVITQLLGWGSGSCHGRSHGWGQRRSLCHHCSLLQAASSERRTLSLSLWNHPLGPEWTFCVVGCAPKSGTAIFLQENKDRILHLNLESTSSSFTVIAQQWLTFQLCLKGQVKKYRRGVGEFPGPVQSVLKEKTMQWLLPWSDPHGDNQTSQRGLLVRVWDSQRMFPLGAVICSHRFLSKPDSEQSGTSVANATGDDFEMPISNFSGE